MKLLSPLLLRFSLALLFFWFGFQQLLDPSPWVGFLPEWIGYFPIPAEVVVKMNGWFEVVFAALLVLGFGTRFVALLLGLHLLGIAWTTGGAIAVRDLALAGACFSLGFAVPDRWTLDHKLSSNEAPQKSKKA